MPTQKGTIIPAPLAEALRQQPELLQVLAKMRPSCHKDYAQRVKTARSDKVREQKIATILGEITKYGQRHKLLKPGR